MINIIVADNEFSYFNELQKSDCEESVEIGYANGKYIAVINADKTTDQEIKDFLFTNKIRIKDGRLQKFSDAYRV